jgi:hypothetical protein
VVPVPEKGDADATRTSVSMLSIVSVDLASGRVITTPTSPDGCGGPPATTFPTAERQNQAFVPTQIAAIPKAIRNPAPLYVATHVARMARTATVVDSPGCSRRPSAR